MVGALLVYLKYYFFCSIVIEAFFFSTKIKKIVLGDLSKGRRNWKMKKIERRRENKVRESKVGVEKYVDFY